MSLIGARGGLLGACGVAAGGGGPAEVIGTPVAITWEAGADPAAQNISVPSDATAAYLFWHFWYNDVSSISTVTLNSVAPAEVYVLPSSVFGSYLGAVGVAAWYLPATGTRSLDVAWTVVPDEGPTSIVVFTRNGNTSAWRDADAGHIAGTTPLSVTLTTQANDLVLKYYSRYQTPEPGNSDGWTSLQTQTNNSQSVRLASISASGASQVCDCEDENYSTLVAIAIPGT
jgi:hypothetical protein